MFAGDSFLTLTIWERAGVLGLSLILAAGLVWVVVRTALPPAWRILLAVGLFWIFLWLSPQVYYLYYLAIFDGLPLQSVIKWPPPGAGELGLQVLFLTQPHLPDLGRGLLFWVMVLAALSPRRGKS